MTESRAIQQAVRESSRLARITGFSDAQISLVQQTVAGKLSRVELAWLLYNARRLDADPVIGEIYAIKYDPKAPAQIVIGIKTYRNRAEATGLLAGHDAAEYEYDDVGQPKGYPSLARITVWKMVKGERCAFVGEARWLEEYDKKRGDQYLKRPWNQLAVRAEMRALSYGFPRQIGRLESAHEDAPQEWLDAAWEDEQARSDPQQIAANARRYDEIFLEPSERVTAEPVEAEAPSDDEPLHSPPGADAAPLATAWQANRALHEQVHRSGFRVRDLRGDATFEEVRAQNEQMQAWLDEHPA